MDQRAGRVREMRTGAWREGWSERKNDDLLASTFQLLNGYCTEKGRFLTKTLSHTISCP